MLFNDSEGGRLEVTSAGNGKLLIEFIRLRGQEYYADWIADNYLVIKKDEWIHTGEIYGVEDSFSRLVVSKEEDEFKIEYQEKIYNQDAWLTLDEMWIEYFNGDNNEPCK